VSLPDPARFDGPFIDVKRRRYPRVLADLLRALAPDCEAAYCLLARPPGTAETDGAPDPKAVWPEIRDGFVPTWTRWRAESVRRRWHRLDLPEHTDDLVTLAGLTVSAVGSSFVHTLALARSGEWLLVAVPHSSSIRVADAREVRDAVAETGGALDATD
jgi:hypothetical protein